MQRAKCKIVRRLGTNIFPKCAKVYSRRPYPPGQKKKRRAAALSEYGKELREKQKLKYLYNVREGQFRNYVVSVLARKRRVADAATAFLQLLERRLDNVVFRLGLASSRQQAKQLVSHGHILVNQRKVTIPSYQVRIGDEIGVRPASRTKGLFQDLDLRVAKWQRPSWLEWDTKKTQGKVAAYPCLEEAAPPAEISSIFEFYSR